MPTPPPHSDPQNPDARLLRWAYERGLFPMADPRNGVISWYLPDPRAILPLTDFHVPRRLARVVRQGRFELRTDTAFEPVMRACARPRPAEPESWIDERLIQAYAGLFAIGHAHSVEAWRDGILVGGLYGVHIGGAFFAESKFSRPDLGGTNASKVCLVTLVERLRERGFTLLDVQFRNPHLRQFGCVEIPRDRYLVLLAEAIAIPAAWEAPRRDPARGPGGTPAG